MGELREALRSCEKGQRKLVLTDGVFSMEGDLAKLPDILELARAHDAVVVVDDSHGVGVVGKTGRGVAEHFGVLGEVDVMTGTLGKALGGAAGGYVASSAEVCDLLAQRSRPQLFSNALPPTVACSARAAVRVLRARPDLVVKLRENTRWFRGALREAGFDAARRRGGDHPDHRRRDRAGDRAVRDAPRPRRVRHRLRLPGRARRGRRASACRCRPRSSRCTSSGRSEAFVEVGREAGLL